MSRLIWDPKTGGFVRNYVKATSDTDEPYSKEKAYNIAVSKASASQQKELTSVPVLATSDTAHKESDKSDYIKSIGLDETDFQYDTLEKYDAEIAASRPIAYARDINRNVNPIKFGAQKRQAAAESLVPDRLKGRQKEIQLTGPSVPVEYAEMASKASDTRIDRLNHERTLLEQKQTIDEYNRLSENADFAENSKFDPHSADFVDLLVNYGFGDDINGANAYGKFRSRYGLSDVEIQRLLTNNTPTTSYFDKGYQYLSDNELSIYNYLNNTAGKDAAQKYIDALGTVLSKRRSVDKYLEQQDEYREDSFIEKGVHQLMTPVTMLVGNVKSAVSDAATGITGNYNPYSSGHDITNTTQAIIGATSQDIIDAIDSAVGSETVGRLASVAYQSTIQSASSALGAAMLGKGYLAVAGAGAASQKAKELYERGATGRQIFNGGVITGLIEAALEYLPLEALFDTAKSMSKSPKNWKGIINALFRDDKFWKSIGKNSAINFTEEGLTDLSNIVSDCIMMGEDSELSILQQQYMEDGESREDAYKHALRDKAQDVAWSAVGGAFGGASSSVMFSAAGYAQYNAEVNRIGQSYIDGMDGHNIDEAISIGLDNAHTTEAYKLADSINKKVQSGQNVTAHEVGRMLVESSSAEAAKARAIDHAVRESARQHGVAENIAEDVANIAAATGRTIEFADDAEFGVALEGDAVVAGSYDPSTGVIKVNAAASSEDITSFLIKHELTHSVEGTEQYDQLTDIVQAQMGDDAFSDAVAQVMEQRAASGQPIDMPAAEREVVADWVGDNLYKGGFAKAIVDGNATVGNAFVRTIDKLRLALGNKKSRANTRLEVMERLFMRALEQDIKLRDGDVEYALNENLGDQLRDWLSGGGKANGTFNGEYFDLGTTPDVFVKHGAQEAKVIMLPDCVVKITGGKHSIALDEIAKVPSELNDPVLLFKGSVPDSFVALTELVDKQGNDVIAAIHINRRQKRLVVNRIASLYSKSDQYGNNHIVSYVNQQIAAGNLLDASTKKAPTWFTNRGLQLPKLVQTIISANTRLSQNDPRVNTHSMQNAGKNTPKPQNAVVSRAWLQGDTTVDRAGNAVEPPARSTTSPIETPVRSQVQNGEGTSVSTAEKSYISMADFADRDSAVWRNVDYNDDAAKSSIMRQTHDEMVAEGAVVVVSDGTLSRVEQSFPDLREMKKKERTPLLKEAIGKLKSDLRHFLNGFKGQTFEFDVDGQVLEAKLYNTGINEVLEKVTQEKASMLYTTQEIFKNARYLYSTQDYDGDPNVYRWNYFYTPVQIGTETVGVRIAVRDMAKQGESQIYNWGIKKDASLGGVRDDYDNRESYDTSSNASVDSIPETLPIVKPNSVNYEALRTAVTVNDVIGAVGDSEAFRRAYLASQVERVRGTVDVDGQTMSADEYMAEHYHALPDDENTIRAAIKQTEAAIADELKQVAVSGRDSASPFSSDLSDHPNLLKLNIQLFAQKAKLEYVLDKGEEGSKTRRFFEQRLKGKDANHNQELVDLLAGRNETYNPIANEKTLDKANARLRDAKYADKLKRRVLRYNPRDMFTAVDMAAVQVMINDAINAGELGEAADLIQSLSRKGTELGRAVQIMSMQARLTPEGTLRAMQRTLQKTADKVICDGASDSIDQVVDEIIEEIEARGRQSISQSPAATVPFTQGDLNMGDIAAAQSYSERGDDRSLSDLAEGELAGLKPIAEKLWSNLGVKSPLYRARNGEWRVHDQTLVAVADTAGDGRGVQRNSDTGWNIQVSGKVFNETRVHKSGANKDAVSYLSNINDIVDKAILLDTHTMSDLKSPNSLFMHTLYAIADIGDGPQLLKLYVEEMYDPNTDGTNMRAYQLQNIENWPLNAKGSEQDTPSPVISTTSIHTVADLVELVKKKDKNYHPKPYSRDFFRDALVDDLSQQPGNYLSKDEIGKLVDKAIDDSSNIPEQVRRYIKKHIKTGTLAERLYEMQQKGHLNAVTLRRAMEEALGLPTLTESEIATVVDLATQIHTLDADPVQQAELMDELYDMLGRKLPVTAWEAVTNWRKFGMLFNVKTHLRNLASNAAYSGVRKVDDLTATMIERLFVRDSSQWSKKLGWRKTEHGQSILSALEKSADLAVLQMQKRGKYEYSGSPLENHRNLFGTSKLAETRFGKAADKASRWNSDMLEREDVIFFRPAYIDALGQIMTARHMTEVTPEVEAMAYQRAAEATFRADNVISDFISMLKQRGGKFRNFGAGMLDIAIPFNKTPANIATQSAWHSPIGIVKGALDLYNATKGKGSKTVADAINTMAKGMTGTALLVIGMLLGGIGHFNTGFGKTEKERAADELAGIQENAFVVGGMSISVDWLQPAAAPLIIGASMAERLQDEGLTFGTVFGSLMDGTDALFDMSMMQSMYDLFGGYDTGATATLGSVAENLISQSIPTVVGQTARSIDPVQRKTKGDGDFETMLNKILAKIPGLTYLLDPELDVWGDEVHRTGKATEWSLALNFLQQFALPFNTKVGTGTDSVSREIQRLYAKQGSGAIPTAISRDEARDAGIDYVESNRALGAVNRQAVEDFVNNKWPYTVQEEMPNGKRRNVTKFYEDMTDEERLRVLKRIYKKAKEQVTEPDEATDDYFADIMRRLE